MSNLNLDYLLLKGEERMNIGRGGQLAAPKTLLICCVTIGKEFNLSDSVSLSVE